MLCVVNQVVSEGGQWDLQGMTNVDTCIPAWVRPSRQGETDVREIEESATQWRCFPRPAPDTHNPLGRFRHCSGWAGRRAWEACRARATFPSLLSPSIQPTQQQSVSK